MGDIISTGNLPIADIEMGERLRPVSAAGVEAIKSSIIDLGVIKDPIHVRKSKSGMILMAGGHRLTAARELGWETIPATLWKCTDDWARLMEVDDNLAGAELTVLDTAVFLAERAAIYERMHPETRGGMAGALAKHGYANDTMSFAEATAEKLGVSMRSVQRLVAAGRGLDRECVELLRAAPQHVTLKDLTEIAKIADDLERSFVVRKMNLGEVRGASEGRGKWAAQNSTAPAPVLDPVERETNALRQLWARSSMAARRRFVSATEADLSDLIAEILDENGGAA